LGDPPLFLGFLRGVDFFWTTKYLLKAVPFAGLVGLVTNADGSPNNAAYFWLTGAVFMGTNTYIGNAPNFMVYAIARQTDVNMPSFFGYMLWSGAVLIPLFGLITFLYF